jgi:hypothetical protein
MVDGRKDECWKKKEPRMNRTEIREVRLERKEKRMIAGMKSKQMWI